MDLSNDPTVRIRQNVEVRIVTKVVDTALAAGLKLAVDREGVEHAEPSDDRAKILDSLIECDDEYLCFYRSKEDKKAFGWVRFVYGNNGWDVINDYTTNLEDIVGPILEEV